MGREKPLALFAGSLVHQTELNHVLQGFRHSGGESESCSAVAEMAMMGFRWRCW
jgi:hypothetical protein